MPSSRIQATPAALDGFGGDARRQGRELAAAAVANRSRLLGLSGKLDGFGVADDLAASYPTQARQALHGVEQLARVLTMLGRASGAAAERFRQADATADATAGAPDGRN